MADGIKRKGQESSETYNKLVLCAKSKNNHDIQDVQKGVLKKLEENLDNKTLSFGFLNIIKAVLTLAPQELNEETRLPNYYISGSLAMNLLPSIDKITLPNGEIIEFDDNNRKTFEICYRKIHDFDFVSTDNKLTVHDIAIRNSKLTISGQTIESELLKLGLSKEIVSNIVKTCIDSKYALILDCGMDEQKIRDFHYCKATIKSHDGNFNVFITDPKYLLGYKFAAYLTAKNDKDKSDFLNLYKGLVIIYGEEELKQICSEYKKLRPDLFD